MHKKEVNYNRDMTKLLILIALLSCAATKVSAQETNKYQPGTYKRNIIMNDIKRNKAFLEKDLGVSEEDIVSLGSSEKALRKIRNDIIPLPKIKRTQQQNPYPPYHALIKRGVRLYSLDLDETFLVSRDTVAMANEIVKGGNLAFVFDKQGNPKYIVISRHIEKIEEHLELESTLDARIEYKRNYRHKIQDYELELEHSLNFHIEDVKAVFFAEIFNGSSTGARANRVEYRAFFPWEFPIDFGFSTSFQDGRYSNFSGVDVADWNAVYVGPYIRTTLDSSDNYKLFASLGIEKSMYFDVAESFQMSTNLWSAVFEGEFKIQHERILFSLGYRSMRGHIKKSIIGDIEENTTRRKIQSIDFSIGYRFGQFL
jgi:hypothetical protein